MTTISASSASLHIMGYEKIVPGSYVAFDPSGGATQTSSPSNCPTSMAFELDISFTEIQTSGGDCYQNRAANESYTPSYGNYSGQSSASPFEQMIDDLSHFVDGLSGNASPSDTSEASGSADSDSPLSKLFQAIHEVLDQIKSVAQQSSQGGMQISSVSATYSTSTATASAGSGTFSNTLLDKFLTQLSHANSNDNGAHGSLTDTQISALENILSTYGDAPASPDTFKNVTDALQQAGINLHRYGTPDINVATI